MYIEEKINRLQFYRIDTSKLLDRKKRGGGAVKFSLTLQDSKGNFKIEITFSETNGLCIKLQRHF